MWIKILLLLFTFAFIFRSDYSFDQDLGRHLKLGEIIWQSRTVPRINLFSYTNPNFPFINTHWLFELGMFLISQLTGINFLLIIKIIIILLSVWITLKAIRSKNQLLLLPLGYIFLHLLRDRVELRPEIFSFLFTSLTYYILEKYLDHKSKLILLLPIIQLIWINTHIYFFVGLTLQLIYLIHSILKNRRLNHQLSDLKLPAVILLISIMASLLNPNGINGFFYPLNVSKDYGYTIVENQTMNLLEKLQFVSPDFLFMKLALAIIVVFLTFRVIQKKFDFRNFALVFLGTTLGLLNVRSFPYLFFLALPALLQIAGPIKKSKVILLLSLISALLLILESISYLNEDYYKYRDSGKRVGLNFVQSAGGAMDFVIKNQLPNPIYNNFDIGSYIIYRGYPNYPVFVDGRPEAYPKEFFQDTYIPVQYDFSKFQNLASREGIKTIIFSHTDQTPWAKNFLLNLNKDQNWVLVYLDDFMEVFVRSQIASTLGLTQIKLADLNPESYSYDDYLSYLRLGIFLLSNGQVEPAKKFINQSLMLFPESPTANALMFNLTGQVNFLLRAKNNFFW